MNATDTVLPILPLRNLNSDQLRGTIVAAFVVLSDREEVPPELLIEDCLAACRRGEFPQLAEVVDRSESS